jgi:hypothetical protein
VLTMGNDNEMQGQYSDSFSLEEAVVDEDPKGEKLTSRETKNVRTWRMIVLLLIVLACVAVSTATFVYVNREDTQDIHDRVRSACFFPWRIFNKCVFDEVL